MLTAITESITISPEFIGPDIDKKLLEIIRTKYINKSTKKYGYIQDITRILEYTNAISTANSAVIFFVQFEAHVIKFDVGDKVTGTVEILSSGRGIFVNVVDTHVKIFVNIDNIGKNITFCDDVYMQGKRVFLRQDARVEVTVFAFTYSNGIYKYLGKDLKKLK